MARSTAESYIPSARLFPALDMALAACSGDDLEPDVALARLPVHTAKQAFNYLAKLIAHESIARPEPWMNRYLMISAGQNPEEREYWRGQTERLITYCVEHHRNQGVPVRIYKGDDPDRDDAARILEELARGAAVVNYLGRAGATCWEDMLWTYSLMELSNAGRLRFVSSMSCYSNIFNEPSMTCMGERFLRLDSDEVGALAVLGASSLTITETKFVLDGLLFDELLVRGERRVAEAFRKAMVRYVRGGFDPYMAYLYNLLRDSLATLQGLAPSCILAGGVGVEPAPGGGRQLRATAIVQRSGGPRQSVRLELLVDGRSTGLQLNDRGVDGDALAGDDVYSLVIPLPDGTSAVSGVAVQIGGVDLVGRPLTPWPACRIFAR